MTGKEAAKIINECKDKGFKHTFYTLTEYHTALDMAIKALEQTELKSSYNSIKTELGGQRICEKRANIKEK